MSIAPTVGPPRSAVRSGQTNPHAHAGGHHAQHRRSRLDTHCGADRMRRQAVRRVCSAVVGLLAVSVATVPPAAASATTVIRLRSSVAVQVNIPAGSGVSLVQTCPAGSVLDVRATGSRAHVIRSSALALVSRELWLSGMVTRWTARRSTVTETAWQVTDAIVCRARVAAGARNYSGVVTTVIRLWHVPVNAQMQFTLNRSLTAAEGTALVFSGTTRLAADFVGGMSGGPDARFTQGVGVTWAGSPRDHASWTMRVRMSTGFVPAT